MPTLDETPAERTVRRAAMTPPELQEDTALQVAIGSAARPAADVARDVYRHPFETLTFWGLTPGSTIVEIQPGDAGWWTAILKPYAEATGGTYVAVNRPQDGMGIADGTADMVLFMRNIHAWMAAGIAEKAFADAYAALRPGGVLGIEQHRLGPEEDQDPAAANGYVQEAFVKQLAAEAGFAFVAASEINANDRDTKDHPFGVETLPPMGLTAPRGSPPNPTFDRSKYEAIGESDRMTLRFRKPE
jgi:predicted methyltransferase